jgi:hypothetical protein
MDVTPSQRNTAAGIGGLLFLFAVIAENALRGEPVPNDAPMSAALTYYQQKQSAIEISHSLYIITIPSLLLYAAGLFQRLRSNLSETWARAGLAAASIMPVSFAIVMITDTVLANLAATGASGEAFLAAFKLHAAAFIVNEAILGTAMLGFGMAASRTNAFTGWLRILAVSGGLILIVAALPIDLVLGGSAFGMIGLAGFLCWLLWVGVTSVKMLKGR